MQYTRVRHCACARVCACVCVRVCVRGCGCACVRLTENEVSTGGPSTPVTLDEVSSSLRPCTEIVVLTDKWIWSL